MAKERVVDTQSCFELTGVLVKGIGEGRDLNGSEISGLQKLMELYGPEEIYSHVAGIIAEVETEPDAVTKNHREKVKEGVLGIHELIQVRINSEDEMLWTYRGGVLGLSS